MLPVIGTVLQKAGYEVEIFMEKVAPIPFDRVLQADLVGFSAVTCTVNPVYEMVRKIKAIQDIPTVLGGPHASMMPDDAIQHVDYAVREEGEETILELLEVLNNGGDVCSVKGISYLREGKPHHNPSRELVKDLDTVPDLSLVHGYDQLSALKLFLQAKGHVHFLETSRGCPYSCKFCWRIGMQNYRTRSSRAILQEIRDKIAFLKAIPNSFMILDSYFGVNRPKAKKLLKKVIDEGIKARFYVFARSEIAEDEELLVLMRRAGVKWIFMGVESLSQKNLDYFVKDQKIDKVERAIDTIHKHGINVTASFILGSDEDNIDAWRDVVRFANQHNIRWVMINSLGELPNGNERLIPRHRIFQTKLDYYNGLFVTFFLKGCRRVNYSNGFMTLIILFTLSQTLLGIY